MVRQVYRYDFRSLLRRGLIFLAIFPLLLVVVLWLLNLARPILIYSLAGVYGADLVLLGWLLFTTWGKNIVINGDTLSFGSKFVIRHYNPAEIKDITLLATQQGKEYVRIRTQDRTYYLDEQFQPWGNLIRELEDFVRRTDVSSNLAD